jgi:hypothetical protein
MKKFVTAVAVVALVAFAAPVFAATNPFMDVPMNHWAYDAIGQLAAHGILSGYPDGLYKGKQPTTRYEMASALARALAVVDMTKASKQDVEMLQKLVVEFHDELEALGVRVDDIEGKVNLLDSRLGGWKISGELRLDIRNDSIHSPSFDGKADGQMSFNRARLRFDRWFGDPENPMHFVGLFDGNAAAWKHYYAEIPFFYDTLLTVGKTPDDYEADYYYGGTFSAPATGGFAGLASTLTDRDIIKFQLEKQFGMGRVLGYVAHPDETPVNGQAFDIDADGAWTSKSGKAKAGETGTVAGSAWELFLMGKFQFNEQFGFDLGFQGFRGDNAEPGAPTVYDLANGTKASLKFNDLWTVFGGLRFNFNENVTFKGIYYHQKAEIDDYLPVPATGGWHDALDIDTSSHWAVMLSVKQEALKFTSLWLEYGQYKQGFASPHGLGSIFSVVHDTKFEKSLAMLPWDMKYFRVGLGQEWNEKWATHLFYYNYNPDPDGIDKMTEWGLGVRYKYNPNVTFGLNFIQADSGVDGADKDNVVRFRTQVTF